MKALLAALDVAPSLADHLARGLEADALEFTLRRFPDGEHYVRVATPIEGRAIIIAADLTYPDEKLLRTMLFADTLRDLGAAKIGLVAPYLPYMRQDARFHPGEGITSRYFAAMLSQHFDWLVTADPHLHRYGSLGEIYRIPTAVARAAAPIARWIAANVPDPVLVGPDSESRQWVEETARAADLPYVVFAKTRLGDTDVKVEAGNVAAWAERTPVLVDDIISTGRTLVDTVRALRAQGLKKPVCVGVHGIFAGDAYQALQAADVARIVTCNTVVHASNQIDLGAELAACAAPFLASLR